MSIVLVTFATCPPPVEDAIARECQLDDLLRTRVKELVTESNGSIELPMVLQSLTDENIPNLPPGGGIAAK